MAVTFTKLPPELACRVCQFLSIEDLFSLRLVEVYTSKIVIRELAKRAEVVSILDSIVVLYTRDGLTILKGLCQIPEFRKHVKKIAFVIAKINQRGSAPTLACHTAAALRFTEEHNLFFESAELRNIVHEILALIKDDHQLSSISVGFVPPSMGPALLPCGSQSLSAKLSKLHQKHDDRALYLNKGAYVQEYVEVFKSLFGALQEVNFNKKIIGVQVIVDAESPEVLKKDDWALFEHPCIARLDLRHVNDSAKVPSYDKRQVHPGSADADVSVPEEGVDGCFNSMRQLEELEVTSHHNTCHVLRSQVYIKPCTICDPLFHSLSHAIFPNLNRVVFTRYVTSGDNLLHFFENNAHQLQSITLAGIGLCKGSWRDILGLFMRMPLAPLLTELRVYSLSEKHSPPARASPYGMTLSYSTTASVKGRDQIERFLEKVMEDYRTRSYLDSVPQPDKDIWGTVEFPGIWG